jgi:hypothetical protein
MPIERSEKRNIEKTHRVSIKIKHENDGVNA